MSDDVEVDGKVTSITESILKAARRQAAAGRRPPSRPGPRLRRRHRQRRWMMS